MWMFLYSLFLKFALQLTYFRLSYETSIHSQFFRKPCNVIELKNSNQNAIEFRKILIKQIVYRSHFCFNLFLYQIHKEGGWT
jgi:hypothetical protein